MQDSEWQPIETAPKDGTNILGYFKGVGFPGALNSSNCYVVYYQKKAGLWIEAAGECWQWGNPTHWMPLPEPPEHKDG